MTLWFYGRSNEECCLALSYIAHTPGTQPSFVPPVAGFAGFGYRSDCGGTEQ